jgi:hypothetical protein
MPNRRKMAFFHSGMPTRGSYKVETVRGKVTEEPTPTIACTLAAGDVPGRLARWAELAAHVAERTVVPGGIRVRFDRTVTPATVAALAADEVACCAFLRFSLRLAPGEVTLEVTAPDDAQDVLEALLPH